MVVTIGALFLMLLAGTRPGECLPWLTLDFYRAENRALLYHVLQAKNASSAVICGRDCSMDPLCKSFNYYDKKHYCELNTATRGINSCLFAVSKGSAYFDNNPETLKLSVSFKNYRSCQMLLKYGYSKSGIYTIYPTGMSDGIHVYCDMTTAGGGWIVFQRRQDGSVDFYRNWAEYQSGFGNLCGEFWLGNDVLKSLTAPQNWGLRVDLGDWEGNTVWAEYGMFQIVGEKYTLNIDLYNASSTAGIDGMEFNNARLFSTKDQDNDGFPDMNCARKHEGAWWNRNCFASHLNGKYYNHSEVQNGQGIIWSKWKRMEYSLKECSMKIREVS